MKKRIYDSPLVKVVVVESSENIMVTSPSSNLGIDFGGNASDLTDVSADVNSSSEWNDFLW